MRFLFLTLAIVWAGCSGSTQNKGAAFAAVFGQGPDASVTVQRAKLWENRHLFIFYEYYALVEFEASDEKVQALLAATKKRFQQFDASDFHFGRKADEQWFVPRDGSKYLGWRSDDGMYVVRSSKTQRVYALRSEL